MRSMRKINDKNFKDSGKYFKYPVQRAQQRGAIDKRPFLTNLSGCRAACTTRDNEKVVFQRRSAPFSAKSLRFSGPVTRTRDEGIEGSRGRRGSSARDAIYPVALDSK